MTRIELEHYIIRKIGDAQHYGSAHYPAPEARAIMREVDRYVDTQTARS